MGKQLLKINKRYISPEMSLLLLCCINEPSEPEYKKIQNLIQDQMDWNAFYKLILRHRVYPIVYKNLKKFDCAEIDSALISSLKMKNEQNKIKILQHIAELTRLMELFEKSAVRVVSIKGPILGLEIYGDVSMRMSKDLDLLVCPAEFQKAEQILIGEGYIREGSLDQLTTKQRAILFKTQHHFSYVNKKKGINIELHWQFYYESYNFDFEEIWAEKAEVNLNGKKCYVLNREENFLYLVFHGSKHAWFRLKWLCDIAELIKKGGLDWNHISQKAKILGIEHLLRQTLLLENQLFRTDSHYELFNKGISRSVSRLANQALAFIFCVDDISIDPTPNFYLLQKKYMIVWNKGLAKKFVFIENHFYPVEADFEYVKLSDKYFMVYFLLRPLLVFKRKLHSFWGRGGKE